MKKAKIMLSAIAVFAIVGGAVAFKAKNIPQTFYYIAPNQTTCTASAFTQTTSSGIGIGSLTSATLTAFTPDATLCTATYTLTIE